METLVSEHSRVSGQEDQMLTFYLPVEPCLKGRRLRSGDMCQELALLALSAQESEKTLSLTGNQEWSPHRSWVLTTKPVPLPLSGHLGYDGKKGGPLTRP